METILLNTTPIQDGCWLTRINARYLERLSPELIPEASTSVVLVDEAEYDETGQALIVRGAPLCPITIGVSDTAIVIARRSISVTDAESATQSPRGNGDNAFLSEAERLPTWAKEAATQILGAIREIDNGQLERGERNKFINRPNNFWTITAQPQAKGLAITIYGRPHLFKSDRIRILDDRPGHSRFVIRHQNEVIEAIRLIKESRRVKS